MLAVVMVSAGIRSHKVLVSRSVATLCLRPGWSGILVQECKGCLARK